MTLCPCGKAQALVFLHPGPWRGSPNSRFGPLVPLPGALTRPVFGVNSELSHSSAPPLCNGHVGRRGLFSGAHFHFVDVDNAGGGRWEPLPGYTRKHRVETPQNLWGSQHSCFWRSQETLLPGSVAAAAQRSCVFAVLIFIFELGLCPVVFSAQESPGGALGRVQCWSAGHGSPQP